MAAFDSLDTYKWSTHCWVTIKSVHEELFQALLNEMTAGGHYFYIPVGEIVLYGLSENNISALISACPDLVYRDGTGAVFVLEELWCEVKDTVARIAPTATIQHRIAINLSFPDPQTIDKLRTELSRHPSLNYVEIEFGDD